MLNQQVFESCFASLKGLLEKLQNAGEQESKKVASTALLFLEELGSLARKSVQPVIPESRIDANDSDPTNYALYELLASYGLTQQQLVAVARTEHLHELRVLRMLRITYGLSLAEAQKVLSTFGSSSNA